MTDPTSDRPAEAPASASEEGASPSASKAEGREESYDPQRIMAALGDLRRTVEPVVRATVAYVSSELQLRRFVVAEVLRLTVLRAVVGGLSILAAVAAWIFFNWSLWELIRAGGWPAFVPPLSLTLLHVVAALSLLRFGDRLRLRRDATGSAPGHSAAAGSETSRERSR